MKREKAKSDDESEDFVDRNLEQSLHRLEDWLAIDENALDVAWQTQPELYYEAAKLLALYVSRRDQAKQRLAVVEATSDRDIRTNAQLTGEKMTEKLVESSRELDENVIEANTNVLRLQHSVAVIQALVSAYDQRSRALKGMSDLFTTNYYQSTSATGGDSKERMKDHLAANARREMNNERRRRGL